MKVSVLFIWARVGSNSRKLEEIFIEFGDREDAESPLNWQIMIEGVHLRAFMFEMIGR